jgi:DNA-binding MarR family transcriptional regulator
MGVVRGRPEFRPRTVSRAWGPRGNPIQHHLRDLIALLHQLNDAVGARVELRGPDLEVLDLIARHGPVSPSEVASATGIHPATLTGVIDRLEEGGWVTRLPDPEDRRRVRLDARHERGPELLRLYGPMNRSLAEICGALTPEQLEVVRDFLRDAAAAGGDAVSGLRVD